MCVRLENILMTAKCIFLIIGFFKLFRTFFQFKILNGTWQAAITIVLSRSTLIKEMIISIKLNFNNRRRGLRSMIMLNKQNAKFIHGKCIIKLCFY